MAASFAIGRRPTRAPATEGPGPPPRPTVLFINRNGWEKQAGSVPSGFQISKVTIPSGVSSGDSRFSGRFAPAGLIRYKRGGLPPLTHKEFPMTTSAPPALVSIHGGHSGEFCQHAGDSLEAILEAYAAQGFAWVGITECPRPGNRGAARARAGQTPCPATDRHDPSRGRVRHGRYGGNESADGQDPLRMRPAADGMRPSAGPGCGL